MRRHHSHPLALLALLALSAPAPRPHAAPALAASAPSSAAAAAAAAQRRPARQRRRTTPAPARPRIDYTNFSHTTRQHRLDCASCHQIPSPNWRAARSTEPFPDVTDYPGHDACLRCHKQQFFRGALPPICSVCHTKTSPRDEARRAFPTLVAAATGTRRRADPSQFATNFPHDIHQDVMARLAPGRTSGPPPARFVRASFQGQTDAPRPVDSCSLCHQTYDPQGESDAEEMAGRPAAVEAALWPKKGTFKTSPADHASCFNCHWKDGGVAPLSSDCAACHKLLPAGGRGAASASGARTDAEATVAAHAPSAQIREKWLRREAVRFRHEIEKHEGLGCTACHIQITSISTLDPASLEVPILTCGGTGSSCHINPRPKAILNREVESRRADPGSQCVKCHVAYGREAIPTSHSDPVPAPKP